MSSDLGARDAGHFAFQIGGTSVVSASGTLTATPAGPLSLTYDGPATLLPTVSLGAGPTAPAAVSPRTVTISLRATLVPDILQADAVLTIGTDRYVLVTRLPSAGGVLELLDHVEAAFLADDPVALYPLMTTDITGSQTAEQFATTWRTQAAAAGRRIVGLTRGEVGTVEASAIGYGVVRVAYRVETRTASGTSTTASEMVLIHQAAGWKLWFTSDR
ncbi:MAG TPA: hypothetical protein VGT60_07355 [Candidatus Limnocylindria bacterium]|nr:hypothetical protein [Candidatus Limnocylindria bacterium]